MAREKDKFEGIDQDWRDAVQGMTPEDVKKRVAEVALNQAEMMRAKKEDQDLTEKQEAYRDAMTLYRESTKINRAKIDFCKMILDGMGK